MDLKFLSLSILLSSVTVYADEVEPPVPEPVIDAMSEAVPVTEPPVNDSGTSVQQFKKIAIPSYRDAHPQFGVEVTFAPNTFTRAPQIQQSDITITSFTLGLEYQPPIVQKLGVFGIGATTGLYMVSPAGTLTANGADFYSYGGQVRYQAKFLQDQVVVPFIGYGVEYFRYHFTNSSVQDFNRSGPLVGLMFSTAILDRQAMQELYQDWGVSRAYALVELRGSSSGDETIPTNPKTWFFGLRVEF
jgi:hypothetical protein